VRQLCAAVLMLSCWGVQAEQRQWYGIVKQELPGDARQWLVGSEPVKLGADADLSPKVGPWAVGACAEVQQAEGAAISVATRTMSHCDSTDYQAYFARYRR